MAITTSKYMNAMAELPAHNELCKYEDLGNFIISYEILRTFLRHTLPSSSSSSRWRRYDIVYCYMACFIFYTSTIEFSLCLQLPYAYCSYSPRPHSYTLFPTAVPKHFQLIRNQTRHYILCHVRWNLECQIKVNFHSTFYTRHTKLNGCKMYFAKSWNVLKFTAKKKLNKIVASIQLLQEFSVFFFEYKFWI